MKSQLENTVTTKPTSLPVDLSDPQAGGVAPYAIAWFLGVPLSLLLVIALLQYIF